MDIDLNHRKTVISLTDAELLGEGLIDYGGPRSFKALIYRGKTAFSDGPVYVVQKIGLSVVEGERTRYSCSIDADPIATVRALYSLSKNLDSLFVPKASRVALDQAMAKDRALAEAWLSHTAPEVQPS